MTFFLVLTAAGLAGLGLMAVPGVRGRHGARAGRVAGTKLAPRSHALPRAPHAPHAAAHALHAAHGAARAPHVASSRISHFLLEPRPIFSVLALTGAVGDVLAETFGLPFAASLVLALAAGLLMERLVLRRIFDLALRFQGRETTPLAGLVMDESVAVTPFRNGRGIVQVVRDGQSIQLSARLAADQPPLEVRVGTRLRIQEVDSSLQRVTVSLM